MAFSMVPLGSPGLGGMEGKESEGREEEEGL